MMTNPNIVNRTTLSIILGKNFTTIDNWIRQGMPYIEKGSKGVDWLFDTTQVIAWRESKLREENTSLERIEIDEAKRRKLVAEASLLELELKTKQRQVILLQEVEEGITHAYLTIKQRLRTIPERIISELINETDETAAREILLNEIDDALLELSQLDYSNNVIEE